ncbi:Predicted membrane protein [Pseudobutyrivibrio sp. UC1225]|uniref:DUF2207 domain-containing protein n=1 Tax=Pseudobutyrivibrio sp. UC1225 TaxID=1798185 RepID=UPI0008E4BE06|nr:DUF2207 domain-containing protein [Pseudobutyrivibrio sp. UC1225]SFO31421.1 Predicted membrane protein [Pseudobutyrivibrio sp. UC1225]
MKKNLRILVLVLCTALGLLTPLTADAASKKDYYIESIDLKVDVQENNVFSVTETIDYNFVKPHHGPVRVFSENHKRVRPDGSKSRIKAKVENLNVESDTANSFISYDESDSSWGNSTRTVKVGVKYYKYDDEHTYTFNYDYVVESEDPLPDEDEFVFNIIGKGWDCYIENVSWEINLPKDFDSSKVEYSKLDNPFEASVNGRTISGSYHHELKPGEAFTVRASLPEGYFKYVPPAKKQIDYGKIIGGIYIFCLMLAEILLVVLIVLLIKGIVKLIKRIPKRYKNCKQMYYPPDGISPREAEVIRTMRRTDKVLVMIPYLANKGFFDISIKEDNIFAFTLKKDDYKKCTFDEKEILLGMFKGMRAGGVITEKGLQKKEFYRAVESLSFFTSHYSANWKTRKSTEIRNKVCGLYEFIRFPQPEKLKELVAENPNYYYVILPYAYAFGLEKQWKKHFEKHDINVPKVEWFKGLDLMTIQQLNKELDRMIRRGNRKFARRPFAKRFKESLTGKHDYVPYDSRGYSKRTTREADNSHWWSYADNSDCGSSCDFSGGGDSGGGGGAW